MQFMYWCNYKAAYFLAYLYFSVCTGIITFQWKFLCNYSVVYVPVKLQCSVCNAEIKCYCIYCRK